MRAIVIRQPGGPDVLELRAVPDPIPGPGEVRVRIAATAVNRADLLQRRGGHPAPAGWPSDIPGLEYAGTVDAAGPGASRWKAGDRVMGLAGGGTYAEAITVPEDEALPVPAGLPLEDAAALPEAGITAHDALISQCGLRAGESVLIHAVGSGVGTTAVQIAAAVGARSIGTSRTGWKLERAREDGLEIGIETEGQDFAATVLEATGGHGADVVLDLVGGPYVPESIDALASLGRIVIVGLVAGATCELDMRTLMRKRATLRGTMLRTRSSAEKVEATRAFGEFALPLLESNRLRPIIDRVLPVPEAATAHALLESSSTYGKIILAW
ncbi:MAG: NAD(P)H-quinone oxidoreductase [Gemmatimonadota bacterium]|jgi:putative PIG3 family NAD(P)H quinone oxidoreductase